MNVPIKHKTAYTSLIIEGPGVMIGLTTVGLLYV